MPICSDDDNSSVNDGTDYSKEENYAVKRFEGHKIGRKKGGKPNVLLLTRWRGWRDAQSMTLEPLQNMVQDWPDNVKDNCKTHRALRETCKKYYLSVVEGMHY
jgi:hypothetical protein